MRSRRSGSTHSVTASPSSTPPSSRKPARWRTPPCWATATRSSSSWPRRSPPSCRSTTRTSCSPPTGRWRSSRRSRSPSSTGSTAASTGAPAFLALGDAYHGDTIGSLSLGDGGVFSAVFEPLCFPVVRTPGYADPGWADKACAAIEAHGEELAAVVIEPLVQGASGMLCASASDVRRLGEACRQAGTLLICDEVATGFGRTGTLFASEQCGVRPDLMCVGKGITGGYLAMSATVASGEVFDAFLGADLGPQTFYHGHSYGGNALAAAVALEHLRLLEAWDVLANVRARAEQLSSLVGRTGRRPARGARGTPARPDGRRRAGAARTGAALGPPGVRRRRRPGRAAAAARRRRRAHAAADDHGRGDRAHRRRPRRGARRRGARRRRARAPHPHAGP